MNLHRPLEGTLHLDIALLYRRVSDFVLLLIKYPLLNVRRLDVTSTPFQTLDVLLEVVISLERRLLDVARGPIRLDEVSHGVCGHSRVGLLLLLGARLFHQLLSPGLQG